MALPGSTYSYPKSSAIALYVTLPWQTFKPARKLASLVKAFFARTIKQKTVHVVFFAIFQKYGS